MLRRLHNWTLEPGPLAWRSNLGLRGLTALPIRFSQPESAARSALFAIFAVLRELSADPECEIDVGPFVAAVCDVRAGDRGCDDVPIVPC